MARAQFASAFQFISDFFRRGPEWTDGQLVDCFVGRQDEAAFAALVHRHGPMVFGVCRQVLGRQADAEDAFQATFLVLARKAGSIRRGQSVGSWLYQVAHRMALRVRAREDQRQQTERETAMMRQTESLDPLADQDLCGVLHEEVRRLPEKYQAPVVLCYLEGKTASHAAGQLGWRESVVRGRLFQARALLRSRLARRGIAMSAGGLGAMLSGQTAAALSPALAEQTVRAALAFGEGAAAGASAQVMVLAESMAATLTRTRLILTALLCLLVGSIGLATGVVALRAPALLAGAPEAEQWAPERGKPDNGDVLMLNVDSDGSVKVPGKKEPLTSQAELDTFLKEQFAEAQKAARQRDAEAKIETAVRVTAHANADYRPVYTVLSLARKVGFAPLDLRPFTKPVDLEVKDKALSVLVKTIRDGVNDGAISALIVRDGEDEVAVPTLEALGKYLKQAREKAALKDDLNFDAESGLMFKNFRAAMETCLDAGFSRIHLGIPADLAVDPAEPPFEDRAIEETAKTPRPQGTGEQAKTAAVAAGLAWLAEHQAADGSWSLHRFHRDGKCGCTATGGNHPIASAALGLLPFLRAGQTHQKGTHAKRVEQGLKFLLTRQGNDGSFAKKPNMYEHGLAAMALCEAYARTGDPQLKAPAQRAIDFIVAAQHEAGGWRYTPRIPGDLSVTAWQVQALRWGHLAGLSIPESCWKNANRYLDSVSTPDSSGYGYQMPNPAPSMTACGQLCRAYFVDEFLLPDKAYLAGFAKGAAYFAILPPSENFRNSYYYYYATHFMNHELANGSDDWNTRMRRVLLASQDWGEDATHQHQKGSWGPNGDAWGGELGRLGMTSFALMTLSASDLFIPRGMEPATDLKAEEVEKLWAELAESNGAVRASQAGRALAAAKQTVPFLKGQLRSVPTADPKTTARWITDLDSAEFEVRERATKELEKLGESATTALQRALDDKPPLEVRQRVEALLNELQQVPVSPEQRQRLRAVRILEQIGTSEARELLETLAGGAAGARLTRSARSALDRLASR